MSEGKIYTLLPPVLRVSYFLLILHNLFGWKQFLSGLRVISFSSSHFVIRAQVPLTFIFFHHTKMIDQVEASQVFLVIPKEFTTSV